jgi:hypothetical protein
MFMKMKKLFVLFTLIILLGTFLSVPVFAASPNQRCYRFFWFTFCLPFPSISHKPWFSWPYFPNFWRFIHPIQTPTPTPIGIPVISSSPTIHQLQGMLAFELANSAQAVHVGDTFIVHIYINTHGQSIITSDAMITYDNTKLQISRAASGNFLPYFYAKQMSDPNKYLITGWEESIAYAKSTTQYTLFATLWVDAKAQGTASLAFECTPGSEADSNINQASDSKDIINCGLLPLTFRVQ